MLIVSEKREKFATVTRWSRYYRVYLKCKTGRSGKGINSFVLNGNTYVSIGKGAVVDNRGYFQFGLSQGLLLPSKVAGSLKLENNSKLVIDGKVLISPGVRLLVRERAVLELEDVFINNDSIIVCCKHLKIGKGTIIGDDVEILESDFHRLIRENFEMSAPITIGSHVWIRSRAIILKGVTIGSGSVVACGAVVNKNVPEKHLDCGSTSKGRKKICSLGSVT